MNQCVKTPEEHQIILVFRCRRIVDPAVLVVVPFVTGQFRRRNDTHESTRRSRVLNISGSYAPVQRILILVKRGGEHVQEVCLLTVDQVHQGRVTNMLLETFGCRIHPLHGERQVVWALLVPSVITKCVKMIGHVSDRFSDLRISVFPQT